MPPGCGLIGVARSRAELKMPMVALAASTALLLFNGTIRTNTLSLDAVAPALCFDSGVVKATGTLVAAACPGAR